MAINLGYIPQPLTVTFVEGGDFVCALLSSEPWPAGIGIELVLSGGTVGTVTWPATVAGIRADWDIPAAEVDELIDGEASTARLIYREADGTTLIWARGKVHAR